MTPALLPPINRRAVLVFAALLVAFLAPWPRWGRGFGAVFSVYGNALIASTDAPPPLPRFDVPPPGAVAASDGGAWAVTLTAGDRIVSLDTRIIAYTPLAIFLALVLATPVPRRRRLVVLVGGGAVMLARLAFAVLVPLRAAPGSVLEIAWTILVTPPVMSYAVPLAFWWVALTLTTSPAPSPPVPRRRARAAARRA